MQTPSALRALRLVTRLAVEDVSHASYELFKTIVASDDLTDQHWAAARLLVEGAWKQNIEGSQPTLGEPKEIFKFIDHHLGLHGEGEDHTSSIIFAVDAIRDEYIFCRPTRRLVEFAKKINCASQPFVKGARLALGPRNSVILRGRIPALVTLASDQWFNSPVPIMEPEEMAKFCEHLAVFVMDDVLNDAHVQGRTLIVLFGMLRSPVWRSHIVTRFWKMLAYCSPVSEELESFAWCLRNATELLDFLRGLPDGEGLKWWYGALWFHYEKLDTTVRDEVERIAKDMSLGDGLSDLNLYLNLIGQEAVKLRKSVDETPNEHKMGVVGMALRTRLIALEGNHHRLSLVTTNTTASGKTRTGFMSSIGFS